MATLYVVGTPIGNLEDITMRALRTLREVSLIAAEDTRKARILLQHYGITTPLTSYFEGNERSKITVILDALHNGDVALISEAGMPGISDPGYPLIVAAIEQDVPVCVIPGPSAHTTALVASGLPSDKFMFIGFLPRKRSERNAVLQTFSRLTTTLLFYEAPHRLKDTLVDMHHILGNRAFVMCRELTKRYEEIWRGDIEGAIAFLQDHTPRGEFTLVVAGAEASSDVWDLQDVMQALKEEMGQGLTRSQAARKVAQHSGWSRRDVYALNTQDPVS
ncbi:MAG: 16S rRNA (cytidine(1402)-2'-O)-methyltransferase [Anaerolineae bacterium]|nr:16S rRNA (cytidine(1402)-2'-O)-methyltransferase [Anaerolineae bacterium]